MITLEEFEQSPMNSVVWLLAHEVDSANNADIVAKLNQEHPDWDLATCQQLTFFGFAGMTNLLVEMGGGEAVKAENIIPFFQDKRNDAMSAARTILQEQREWEDGK